MDYIRMTVITAVLSIASDRAEKLFQVIAGMVTAEEIERIAENIRAAEELLYDSMEERVGGLNALVLVGVWVALPFVRLYDRVRGDRDAVLAAQYIIAQDRA